MVYLLFYNNKVNELMNTAYELEELSKFIND